MEKDITLLQDKKQEKFAFLQEIKIAMDKLGWNAARLSRESGVNKATISRALKKGNDISGDNLYNILKVLGLLNNAPFIYPYKEDNKIIHEAVERILNGDDDNAINALNFGIRGILSAMKQGDELLQLVKKMAEDIENLKQGDAFGVVNAPPTRRPRKKSA